MATENFKSVEARTIEASRIAREACENAYREGFEAGAKAMRAQCITVASMMPCADEGRFGDGHCAARNEIECAISILPLPTPTTKG